MLTAGQALGREQARQLLLTGAAGTGRRVGRSTAYDEDLVHALARRPSVQLASLAAGCPMASTIARIPRGWCVATMPIVSYGGLPWAATVSGFAVFAAVATGARPTEGGHVRFDLEPAGAWREAVEGRRFHTGAGRHWFSWHPDRLTAPTDTMPAWPPHPPAS